MPPIPPLLSMPEGGLRATETCIRAWRPADAAQLAGRYRLHGITDGHGWLDVAVRKSTAKGWRVDVKVVTEWTEDEWTTAAFENVPVEQETPLLYFEAGRRHFHGFFVHFIDFDSEKRGPKGAPPSIPAVVLGRDVFVRDDDYKPEPYRKPPESKPAVEPKP